MKQLYKAMTIKVKQAAGVATWRRAQRGASLVEILVVLVILLIGVFSVIRVFPIGLLGLRQAESRTLASRLAAQLMEQIKSDETNLPQGVLFTYTDPSSLSLVPIRGEDPDSFGGYPSDDPNPYFSDVNKFRTVVGEAVKVPLPTATAGASGSLYTVKFGPIYMDASVGNPEATPNYNDDANLRRYNSYLRVYGPPLRGYSARYEANNENNVRYLLRGPNTYLIAYGEENEPTYILFPARPPRNNRDIPFRLFRVAFSYEVNNQVRSTIVPIKVDDDDEHKWVPIPGDYPDVFPGSETVSREFTRIRATGRDWDEDDPYEYKLLSPNASPFANMGLVAFNPAGANYSERTAYGQQAFTAYIDYSVLDWHIIREDREVPSAVFARDGAIPIKLTLNAIKRTGDVEPDQTTYQGLYRNATPTNAQIQDIQVFNLQTGATLQGATFDDSGADPRDPEADYWVDTDGRSGSYRTGTIYINERRVERGSQLRILYRAEGDWALAVQKAFAQYRPALDESSGDIVYLPRPNDYDSFGQDYTQPTRPRLYFDLNDLNKSVVATFEYTRNDARTDNLPTLVRTPPIQFAIDEKGIGEDARYAFVDLASRSQDIINKHMPGIAAGSAPRVVGTISGVSLKVRVIWKDNASTSNAWRVQDLNTYITRSASSQTF